MKKIIFILSVILLSVALFAWDPVFPSKYNTDINELFEVPEVRNQLDTGTCWAFGACASMECCTIKKYNYNPVFSPLNIVNRNPVKGTTIKSGGNYFKTMSYLNSLIGPVAEKDDPFVAPYKSPDVQPAPIGYCENAYILTKGRGMTQQAINNIKFAVSVYGGTTISFYVDQKDPNTFSNNKLSYYCPKTDKISNHTVLIVGWDDDYSRNNFKVKPPKDGAFLIKNSWGATENKGFLWVSYCDASIDEGVCYDWTRIEDIKYTNMVSYNKYSYNVSIVNDNCIEGIVLYSFSKSCKVHALRVFCCSDCNLEMTLLRVKDKKSNPEVLYNDKKTLKFEGYRTIKLDTPISINKDDQIMFLLKYENQGNKVELPLEKANEKVDANIIKNVNMYSIDGENIKTLDDCNICAGLLVSE